MGCHKFGRPILGGGQSERGTASRATVAWMRSTAPLTRASRRHRAVRGRACFAGSCLSDPCSLEEPGQILPARAQCRNRIGAEAYDSHIDLHADTRDGPGWLRRPPAAGTDHTAQGVLDLYDKYVESLDMFLSESGLQTRRRAGRPYLAQRASRFSHATNSAGSNASFSIAARMHASRNSV